MDKYLALAIALGVVVVLVLIAGVALPARDAQVSSFSTRSVLVHCKAVFEANGVPVPGVMVYASGSSITDGSGICSVYAEGDRFVRLMVYPPMGGQKIVTVPVAADENEVNVVIPI